MTIIFSSSSNIPVFTGISAALTANKEKVLIWDVTHKPVFDMLEESKPSFIFVTQQEITPSLVEGLLQYPKTKLVVYGTSFPEEISDQIGVVVVPMQVPDSIRNNIGAKTIKLKQAANIVQFSGGYHDEKLKSDILYITNSKLLTKQYIHTHINGLLFNTEYVVKVIGSFKMSSPQYIGRTTMSETLNFIQSAKIVLDYDWDMALDVVANKSFVLSNVQNDLVPYYSSQGEMMDILDKYITNDKARRKLAKSAYETIINKDTYFHRAAELGELLGVDWTTKSMDMLKRYRK